MNIKIYRIFCKDPSIIKCYIGSTKNFEDRVRQHKATCVNPLHKCYNLPLYQFIRTNGGFNNWNFEVLEEFECESYIERLKKEKHYFLKYFVDLLNKNHPYNEPREYYNRNRDKLLAVIKIKHECTCGKTYSIDHKSRHERSMRHKQGHLYNITNNFDLVNDFNI